MSTPACSSLVPLHAAQPTIDDARARIEEKMRGLQVERQRLTDNEDAITRVANRLNELLCRCISSGLGKLNYNSAKFATTLCELQNLRPSIEQLVYVMGRVSPFARGGVIQKEIRQWVWDSLQRQYEVVLRESVRQTDLIASYVTAVMTDYTSVRGDLAIDFSGPIELACSSPPEEKMSRLRPLTPVPIEVQRLADKATRTRRSRASRTRSAKKRGSSEPERRKHRARAQVHTDLSVSTPRYSPLKLAVVKAEPEPESESVEQPREEKSTVMAPVMNDSHSRILAYDAQSDMMLGMHFTPDVFPSYLSECTTQESLMVTSSHAHPFYAWPVFEGVDPEATQPVSMAQQFDPNPLDE